MAYKILYCDDRPKQMESFHREVIRPLRSQGMDIDCHYANGYKIAEENEIVIDGKTIGLRTVLTLLKDDNHYDMVITDNDFQLSGGGKRDGEIILKEVKRRDPSIEVILITAHGAAVPGGDAFRLKGALEMCNGTWVDISSRTTKDEWQEIQETVCRVLRVVEGKRGIGDPIEETPYKITVKEEIPMSGVAVKVAISRQDSKKQIEIELPSQRRAPLMQSFLEYTGRWLSINYLARRVKEILKEGTLPKKVPEKFIELVFNHLPGDACPECCSIIMGDEECPFQKDFEYSQCKDRLNPLENCSSPGGNPRNCAASPLCPFDLLYAKGIIFGPDHIRQLVNDIRTQVFEELLGKGLIGPGLREKPTKKGARLVCVNDGTDLPRSSACPDCLICRNELIVHKPGFYCLTAKVVR